MLFLKSNLFWVSVFATLKLMNYGEDSLKRYFDTYCKGSNHVTIFDCKCAAMTLTGQNISLTKIKKTLTEECNWKQDEDGVSSSQFEMLINFFSKSFCSHQLSGGHHFKEFDNDGKGHITLSNFVKVGYFCFLTVIFIHFVFCHLQTLSGVAPALSTHYGRDIFSAADINQLSQVRCIALYLPTSLQKNCCFYHIGFASAVFGLGVYQR